MLLTHLGQQTLPQQHLPVEDLSRGGQYSSLPQDPPISVGSLSVEIDTYVHQSSDAAEPSIHNVRVDPKNDGGIDIMEIGDEGE